MPEIKDTKKEEKNETQTSSAGSEVEEQKKLVFDDEPNTPSTIITSAPVVKSEPKEEAKEEVTPKVSEAPTPEPKPAETVKESETQTEGGSHKTHFALIGGVIVGALLTYLIL